jgi:hypothetical protein
MEKYVLEALFVMGEADYGLERMKKRYNNMVEVSPWSTLYENFGDGTDRSGYGTNNHAWSGGGLTILAQYVCGLEPIEPAWKTFKVKPQLGNLQYAETGNETVAGIVAVKVTKVKAGMDIELTVPERSEAAIYVPAKNKKVSINGKKVSSKETDGEFVIFRVKGGVHKLNVR